MSNNTLRAIGHYSHKASNIGKYMIAPMFVADSLNAGWAGHLGLSSYRSMFMMFYYKID